MEVINAGMRKGIKLMCKASQTMQFLYLMPKPQDFVTRIVGDVVYLSAGVKKLSDDMNKLLDSYADIPANYLMTQMNSITGSLTGIVDRVSTYAQNAVNQTVGLGENAVNIVTELTGDAIDLTGSLTSAIVSLGSAVTETSTLVLGNTDKAEDIYDATEVILEWTGDGFKNVSEKATAPLKKASQKLVDTRTGITSKIDEKASKINDTIEAPQRWVESLITQLREKMQKLYNVIDGGFKDVTGMTSVSSGSSKVTEALLASGDSSKATQATVAMTTVVSEVIKNFSIGKMIGAFAGVLTQSVIVRLGLDELPPIDFESMMCRIRDDMTVSNEELYNRYDKLLESTYNDAIMVDDEMSQVKEEERNYSAKNYKEFISAYNEELKTQRDNIRTQMKNATLQSTQAESQATKKELKSAIKEVEKYRKQINRAKKASDLKESIGAELDNLKQEAEYRCNTLKSDWQSMMKQYKDAINEIKEFFMNGGSCDRFIDDCCDAINKDFDDIKSLCKNLITQLIGCGIKIFMPADVGPVVPNPIYKLADFWMDIKTIIKFIKDLITLIMDIINNINKLARLILNGLNSLKEIIEQLMELLGLRWLMDLIQNVIDFFGGKMGECKNLANMLSPVYFGDTDQYNNTVEALEEFLDGNKYQDESVFADVNNMLESVKNKKNEKEISKLMGNISTASKWTNPGSNEDAIGDLLDELEEQSEVIVAYKSPILEVKEESSTVSDMMSGGNVDDGIKFIGWHFFHPNLEHTGKTYYTTNIMKRIKSKIIQRASKTSNRKNGGVNKLHSKKVGRKSTKIDEAYTAFYWYTYYTEDMEKDCFEWSYDDGKFGNQGMTYVDSIIQTENGSIVELSDGRKVFVADNNVRSGDYVNVEGVKYRVK